MEDVALKQFKKQTQERKEQEEFKKYKERFKPISSNELQKKEPDPFPYLLDGLIPDNALTVIAGNTGCGKSLFCLYMVDRISREKIVWGQFKTKKTKVLYIDLEMNEEDYIYRTRTLCEEENNVAILYESRWKIEDKSNVDVLKEYIEVNGIGLVVFDTLSKIHYGEENSNTEMTKVMDCLLEIINELKISIILIHHHNKGKDNEGMFKGRGAGAIADNCASYLEVKSKTIKDELGVDMLVMDIEQHKRRRSSIGSFGLNIQFYEKDKALFQFREESIKQQDELELIKPKVLDFIKRNPGLSQNKIVNNLKVKGEISEAMIKDSLYVLTMLKQLEEKIGVRKAKIFFLKSESEQTKI